MYCVNSVESDTPRLIVVNVDTRCDTLSSHGVIWLLDSIPEKMKGICSIVSTSRAQLALV